MATRRTTPAPTDELLRALFHAGLDDDAIGAQLGLTAGTVRAHRHRLRLLRARTPAPPVDEDRVRDMHTAGLSTRAIAVAMGITHRTAQQVLHRLRLPANRAERRMSRKPKRGRPKVECPRELVPYLGRWPLRDLAAYAGVSDSVVRRWQEERGIDGCVTVTAPRVAIMQSRIRQLWDSDLSMAEIGRHLGVSRERVRQIAMAEGLPPRSDRVARDAATVRRVKQERTQGRQARGSGASRRIAEVETLLGTMSDYDVAQRIGAHVSTVQAYRSRAGIPAYGGPPAPTTHRPGRQKAAYLLRQQGLTWREVGNRLGLKNACDAAKGWARANNKPWPVPVEES